MQRLYKCLFTIENETILLLRAVFIFCFLSLFLNFANLLSILEMLHVFRMVLPFFISN